MVEIVEEEVSDVEAVARSESFISRGAAIGAAIGVVFFVIVGGLLGLSLGQGPGTAFAISGFAAIWGGLGFGAMFGGVSAYNRDQARTGRPD